jgi:cytoskeletal protein CcmA (bactofilin family)
MAQARQSPSSSKPASGGASSIGAGTRVRGRVTGDGDLVVAGHVEGDITIQGDVTIDPGATCTSNVEGNAVTIGGSLEGDVSAAGAISVGAAATLRGNVRGSSFSIEDGARFAGRVECEFELPEALGGSAAARRR